MIELWREDDDKRATVIEYRRLLAADSRQLTDVIAYALTLRDRGDARAGVAMLETAQAYGYTLTDKDRAFLDAHPCRRLAPDEAYRGTVTSEEYTSLIADRDDEPMATLLSVLWEAAALLWSEPEDALERCMVIGAERVSAKRARHAGAMFPRVTAALGAPATLLYRTQAPDTPDVQVVCVSPPIVVIGPRFQGLVGTEFSELELRFALGRAAELVRPSRIIATGLPRGDFEDLVQSAARVFGPDGLAEADADDAAAQRDEMLRTTLPVKLRTRVVELLGDARKSDLNTDHYLAACHRAADRAGLIVSGDIATAMREANAVSSAGQRLSRHLLETTLRAEYLPVRTKLGIGG